VVVTAVAVLAAVAHILWPNVKIDTITVLLAVIALLPWLGELLESIELPGGWKVKYHSLEERQNLLERATAELAYNGQLPTIDNGVGEWPHLLVHSGQRGAGHAVEP
jgi:hypothetical protein